MLNHPSLACRTMLSGWLFQEAGNLKDCFAYIGTLSVTFFCVLQNIWNFPLWSRIPAGPSHLLENRAVIFLWVSQVQFIQHTFMKSRQVQFLAQLTSLFTLNANSIPSFSDDHQLLWSNCCCQQQTCLTVEKILSFYILNAIFCRSLKGLKNLPVWNISLYI